MKYKCSTRIVLIKNPQVVQIGVDLSCFHSLAIKHETAVKIHGQIFVWMQVLSSPR